jgi:hypothetical protein
VSKLVLVSKIVTSCNKYTPFYWLESRVWAKKKKAKISIDDGTFVLCVLPFLPLQQTFRRFVTPARSLLAHPRPSAPISPAVVRISFFFFWTNAKECHNPSSNANLKLNLRRRRVHRFPIALGLVEIALENASRSDGTGKPAVRRKHGPATTAVENGNGNEDDPRRFDGFE